MTNKYIITNCPNISTTSEDNILCYECNNSDYGECWRCMDRNCLLKQIVEKCKDVSGCSDFAFGQRDKADEILSILEIQECE